MADFPTSQLSSFWNVTDIKYLYLMALGLFVAIGIFLLVRHRQAKTAPYAILLGKITDKPLIQRILQDAFDLRYPFEIQIMMGRSTRKPSLRCSLEYFGPLNLSLEVSGLKKLSNHWKNRTVTVFFRTRQGNGDMVFFSFPSYLKEICTQTPDQCTVTLPLPQFLEHRQKRSFLRIAPPPEYFLGAALWHGTMKPVPLQMHNLSQWPRPLLLLIPNKISQLLLHNFSAGGVRIEIPSITIKQYNMRISAIDEFILMLDLIDPENSNRLRLWLQCKVQSVTIEPPYGTVMIGAKFTSWGKPKKGDKPEANSTIEWLRLSPAQEVEPIGNWIMRRHLEMFRDHP